MSNLIEITQAELVELIGLSDRHNAMPIRFGGNHVWLDLDAATNVHTDRLKVMRRKPSALCSNPRNTQESDSEV